jgi:hypothetical protein
MSNFATGVVLDYNVTRGGIRHVAFNSSVTRTSNDATILLRPNGATVFDVTVDNPCIGIENRGTTNQLIGVRIGITGITGRNINPNCGGVYISVGLLQISNAIIAGNTSVVANMPAFGVRNRGEVDITNSYIFLTDRGIWADPQVGGGIMGMADAWLDSLGTTGILYTPAVGVNEAGETSISSSWITCGHSASLCSAAIDLNGNARSVNITGNLLVAYNGFGGANAGAGVHLGQGLTDIGVTISGNSIGLGNGLGFANGVFSDSGNAGWNVTGNIFRGNAATVTISAGNDNYVVSSNNMATNVSKITNLSSGAANGKIGMNTGVNIITPKTCGVLPTVDSEGRVTSC